MLNKDSTYCMALFSADRDVFLFTPDGKVKKSLINKRSCKVNQYPDSNAEEVCVLGINCSIHGNVSRSFVNSKETFIVTYSQKEISCRNKDSNQLPLGDAPTGNHGGIFIIFD